MIAVQFEDEAAWHRWRPGGFGSSDAGAARTGLYGGRYKVVATKIGVRVDEINPELAERGHRWEHPIADGVHAHTGYYVGGEQLGLENDHNCRYRCTPDGLLFMTPTPASVNDADAGLEIKTRGVSAPWRWDYWITQCQWCMLVAGLNRWLLAIATIDTEFDPTTGALREVVAKVHYQWIYADALLQADLAQLADELLGYVDRRELPEPTEGGALPYVKAANATSNPKVSADIDDLADLIARYEELKAAAKAAEDERNTAEAVLRARMGEATEATTSDGAWRVRVGVAIQKFTSDAEADFIDLHCTHRPDCGPDCDEHRPDLLIATLYRDMAKDEMPDKYEALKRPTTDRRLTIKNMED